MTGTASSANSVSAFGNMTKTVATATPMTKYLSITVEAVSEIIENAIHIPNGHISDATASVMPIGEIVRYVASDFIATKTASKTVRINVGRAEYIAPSFFVTEKSVVAMHTATNSKAPDFPSEISASEKREVYLSPTDKSIKTIDNPSDLRLNSPKKGSTSIGIMSAIGTIPPPKDIDTETADIGISITAKFIFCLRSFLFCRASFSAS